MEERPTWHVIATCATICSIRGQALQGLSKTLAEDNTFDFPFSSARNEDESDALKFAPKKITDDLEW